MALMMSKCILSSLDSHVYHPVSSSLSSTGTQLSSSLCCFPAFPSPVLCAHLRQEQVPPEPFSAEGPARDSGAIRFLWSVFTRLLAQNRDVFTNVLFTISPYAPTPSVDFTACTSTTHTTTSSTIRSLGVSIDYFLSVVRSTTF
jgi:hypothetical protein